MEKEIVMAQGSNQIALNYHLKNRGQEEAVLCVTPFFQFEPKGEDLKEDKIFSRQDQKITDGKYNLFFETNGETEEFQAFLVYAKKVFFANGIHHHYSMEKFIPSFTPESFKTLLREVGACFSVNNMLRAECYKQRMEKGLSFLEFNYMIMQSYDFYYLFQHYGCNMQFGGDDQWSNMLGGTELIRRKLGKDAHAMTITLLTDSQGKKMGKTAGNAVWLDPNKTSPFDFYQYWRNVDDADVMKCIRMLTFLPLEQIDEMDKWEGSQLNKAKEILAYELTQMVHGEEEAKKAEASAKALFGGSGSSENMPSTELADDDFTDGKIDTLTLLVKCGLAASKGEGRRLVQQGGISVNDEKVTDFATAFEKAVFAGDGAIIRKGKKVFHKALVK